MKKLSVCHNNTAKLAASRRNIIKYNQSDKSKKLVSERMKINNPMFKYRGIKFTEEHKLKISKSRVGIAPWNKGLTKHDHPSIMSQSIKVNPPGGNFKFKDTKIELKVEKLFNDEHVDHVRSKIVRFKIVKHNTRCTVPDFFIKPNLCIYVDGCYWHFCPICGKNQPLNRDRTLDDRINKSLLNNGYKYIRIWEHELKSPSWQSVLLEKLKDNLQEVSYDC